MAVCAYTAGVDMRQDEIIEMAVQAGMAEEIAAFNIPIIEAFAKLVAAKALAQRTWVGLTVEEIAACCRESTTTQLSFYNAIEAKLKEKNT
jgi:hypothetical protein